VAEQIDEKIVSQTEGWYTVRETLRSYDAEERKA